jgi:hypothetical protein
MNDDAENFEPTAECVQDPPKQQRAVFWCPKESVYFSYKYQ